MAPTPRRHQEESFFGVVTEIIFGLVDSTGGPIVVLLFLVAISIIVYAALSLYRMCKEEFRDRETEIDSFEVRRPLPRRVYEIQAEEGVLDGVFLSPDELSDGHSKPTIWKPALPLETLEEFEKLSFEPKKKKSSVLSCFRPDDIDYV